MLPEVSKMVPLLAHWLVWFLCGFLGSVTDANAAPYYRDTSLGKQNDNRCENRLHPEAGLSFCGPEAFNPAEATCCEVGHRHALTKGASQMVSSCCDLTAYNSLNEICCQSAVIAKPAAKAQCCGKEAIDEDKQLCCGPADNKTILNRTSSDHRCCGHEQYNSQTECCCVMNEALEKHPKTSHCCRKKSEASDDDKDMLCGPDDNKIPLKRNSTHHLCCGHKQYDSRTQCCCVMDEGLKTHPITSHCCVKKLEAIDEDKQLSCGPDGNKTILRRISSHHLCCGHKQYDSRTECCCVMNEALEKHPNTSPCCVKESEASDDEDMLCGPDDNKRTLKRNSSHHLCCGHDQYDSRTQCCCVMNEALQIHPNTSPCCVKESGGPGPHPACIAPQTSLCGSTCYDPNEFRCCDTNEARSPPGRCDAVPTVYSPHTHVCCDGRVSEKIPTKHQVHGSPGQHCCGTDVYGPNTQICCNGHRHPKGDNRHCCGVQAYNAENEQMKCCAGTLYNLTQLGRLGHEARCCGNILQTPQDVCCISEDKEVLYSAKTGFGCCGHLYYNASLWSCCAGELSPAQKPAHHHNKRDKGSTLLSLDNLSERHLCEQILIGTVESVSLHSILFSSVLRIYGRSATVRPLPSPYILNTPDHCNFPKLSLGKTYVFDEVNVFACDSVLQSLHFIFSKCYRR